MKQITNYMRLSTFFLSLIFIVSCAQPKVKRYADGLRRGIPENEGVGSHGILDFIEEVDNNGLELHSFMFLRHGKVIAEGWWYPYRPEINHLMHSVSKTFTSTAIGFAVNEGLLTVNDKVISFFPDDLPPVVSPNLEKLTIKHLLTMTAGHETPPVFTVADGNWVRSYLATPIVNEPGTVFSYSSYASYMLSAIVQKVSGMTTFNYLKPRLFEPLEITDIQWETDPRGITCGGWGLRIKTSDMAKFGQFYLQNGKWGQKQLLPAEWIREATSVHIYQVDDPTFEQEMYDEGAQGYGYQIWRTTHNAYRADGSHGQYIVVMPDQDAVIAITARVPDMHSILRLLWEHLFPSIMEGPIKPDDLARDLLTSKLISLQIPDPFRSVDYIEIPKETTRSYTFEPNQRNIQYVSFNFDENGECLMTLQQSDISYSFNFGLDIWRYGETEKPGPYFLNPRRNPTGLSPFQIAGYGSWTAEDQLNLRLLYITDIQDETYKCTFSTSEIRLEITNSIEPDSAIILKGTLNP